MLTGVDKKTGEMLPDENIRAQCITFLIAGHETTSGLLSFAIYYLLNNPDVLARARAEVDEVFGTTAAPTFEQVHRLRYVRQILDETLRLWPTAPGFTRQPFEDTVIGGRYAIPAHTPILVLSQALHLHTEVWGPDAAEFNPDHTAAERMTAIPPNAYKPFGTGARACIGRQFAIQEALLVLGMLVQRFEFVDHLHYELKTKTTLTIKPDDFHILVRPRPGVLIERTGPEPAAASRVPTTAPATGGRTTGRPARDAAVGAVRLEPRHRGVDRRQARAGGHRARLRRHPRRAGRPRRRPPPRRRGADRLLVLQRDSPGQRRRLLPAGSAAPPRARPTASPTRSSAAATPSGPRPTRPCRRCSTTQLAAHGGRRVRDRGEGNAAGDFDAAYRDWHGGLWSDLATALNLPAEVGEADGARRPAAVDHADQPPGHQPGHRLLRGAARHRAREPRAARRHERQAARSGRRDTSRSP